MCIAECGRAEKGEGGLGGQKLLIASPMLVLS